MDVDWRGPGEGDFFRPFNRLAKAMDEVADGGSGSACARSQPRKLFRLAGASE